METEDGGPHVKSTHPGACRPNLGKSFFPRCPTHRAVNVSLNLSKISRVTAIGVSISATRVGQWKTQGLCHRSGTGRWRWAGLGRGLAGQGRTPNQTPRAWGTLPASGGPVRRRHCHPLWPDVAAGWEGGLAPPHSRQRPHPQRTPPRGGPRPRPLPWVGCGSAHLGPGPPQRDPQRLRCGQGEQDCGLRLRGRAQQRIHLKLSESMTVQSGGMTRGALR